MKKNRLFLALLSIIAISVSSCNKTYNCECSERGRVLDVIPITSLGKMGAKDVCDTYQNENNRNGAHQVCVIK